MKRIINTRPYLYLELAVLMMGVPILLSTIVPIKYMLPTMWLITLYCHIVYRELVHVTERVTWRWPLVNWAHLRPILVRFLLCTILLSILVAFWKPQHFLSFVCEKPYFWAFVMVAYPILSVVPQEIIFRSFFFQRYSRIFPSTFSMVLASGVMFGAAHLIFQNWVAPSLCVIGGLIFAHTYAKTRSLALVAIEHALYGCMMFTVGLGTYFYHGAVYSTHEVKVSKACAYIAERVETVRSRLF